MATTASGIYYPVITDDVDVSGDMLLMANSIETLIAKPLCKLIMASGTFGIANSSNAVSVPFGSGSESIKTHAGMHSTTVNNTRIIPPLPGYYECWAVTVYAPNTSGFRTHSIGKNGVRQGPEQGIYTSSGLASGSNQPLPAVITELSANGTGDYFELFTFQNSGGALNIVGDGTTTATGNTTFVVKYTRPL
jgi:hypothetical protein